MKRMVVCGFVMLFSAIALADDESDRSALVTHIGLMLDDAGGSLSRVASASSPSDIDDASSDVRSVESDVGRLADIKGDDERANDIVEHFPEYIRSYDEAARALRALKEQERSLDAMPQRCKDDESALQKLIADYVASADEKAVEGLDKIPEAARKLGEQWGPELERWKSQGDQLQELGSEASLSISDDAWSSVASNLGSASYAVFSHWTQAYGDAQAACSRIALGDKDPDVVKAIDDLSTFTGNVKQTFKQLKVDYDAWYADVKKAREFTNTDLTEMRDALCNKGEYEVEAAVNAIADRWASQINDLYGSITGQGARLLDRASAILKRAPKSTPKLITAINDNLASLAKIKDGVLQGSNNPKIRAKLEYGKQEHLRRQESCSYHEITISSSYCENKVRDGSDCRLDCVMATSDCMVIEIKPDTKEALAEGHVQVEAYTKGLANWFAQDPEAVLKKMDDLKQCVHGEGDDRKLELDPGEVQEYKFCPASNDELGDAPAVVNDEVPDEASEVNH